PPGHGAGDSPVGDCAARLPRPIHRPGAGAAPLAPRAPGDTRRHRPPRGAHVGCGTERRRGVTTLLHLYHGLPISLRSAAATARGSSSRYWRYGPRTASLVEEALERDTWSRASWQDWQQVQLAQVLHRAATQVPYYREQWSLRRRRGDRASLEVLANWPILEKEAVQRYGAGFVGDVCGGRRSMCVRSGGAGGAVV